MSAWGWCLATTAAFALALAPTLTRAAPAPETDGEVEAESVEPESVEPESVEPESVEPEAEEAEEVELEPDPVPEPEPESRPVDTPVEGPRLAETPIDDPSPEARAKIRTQRKAGVGVMATGGAIAVAGFGMTLAFTILGDKAQSAGEPVVADIERNDSSARIGGILLASGIAVVAIGGIVLVNAKKKAESRTQARIRMAPALGGLVVSGRF